MSVVSGIVGGIVGYFGGSKIGDGIYNAGKKLCSVAGSVASSAWNSVKSGVCSVVSGAKKAFSAILG